MKEAAQADNEKLIVGGVRFFLGGDREREELEDESSDEEGIDIGKLRHQAGVNKKSKKTARALEKAAPQHKKKEEKKNNPIHSISQLFTLTRSSGLCREPVRQTFAKHKVQLNLEQKLMVFRFVSVAGWLAQAPYYVASTRIS